MKAITILTMTTILVIIFSIAGCGQDESELILPEDQYFMPPNDMELMSQTNDTDAIEADMPLDDIGEKAGCALFRITESEMILDTVKYEK